MLQTNVLKQKFARGEPAYGCNLMFPSAHMVEIIGRLGFDWVFIDCEHGAIGLESLDPLIVAAERAGIVPIVRPASNDPIAIGQVLDRGAHGIQVPHVDTAADARRAVASARYAPAGERGLAAGTRASDYGIDFRARDFIERSNREILVCVQIEHKNALDHLDELVTVEGVDVFFVGPMDLSLSLGHPADFEAPPVRDALQRCFATIHAAGKISGASGNGAAVKKFREAHVQYLYTHVQTLMADGRDKFRAVAGGA